MSAYAMYLRKSRADVEAEARGEGETLARHEQTLIELAKNQKLPIVQIYREIVSGDTIDARPEVQKLLDDVEKKLYTGVLVMDPDRLARGDSVDQGIIARAFRLSGTKIITPRKTYDPNSEFDEEYFEFEMFMARREYNMIKRRIQRGRIASVKEGKYISSVPPYGYDRVKIKNDKGYTLAPNKEADTVKYVYSEYLSGKGATVIAHALDDMGIPSRSGNPWSKASIIDMLKNPVYIGKIRWSYYKDAKESIGGKITKVRRRNDEYIYVDGLHPAIISTDDFHKAQQMLKDNAKKPVKASNELQNPFTGLIYCGLCGSKMTRLGENSRNKYDTIKCTNRKCNCVSAPIYLVEQVLLDTMQEWLNACYIQVDNIPKNTSAEIFEKSIKELEAQMLTVTQQIEKTYDLLEQGIYTVEIFTHRNKELSDKKADVTEKINCLKNQINNINNQNNKMKNIVPRIEQVINLYPLLNSAEKKNLLLKNVLSRIEYKKNTPNRRGQINNANFTIDIFPSFSEKTK